MNMTKKNDLNEPKTVICLRGHLIKCRLQFQKQMSLLSALSSVKSFKLKNKRETDFTALRNVTSYICK